MRTLLPTLALVAVTAVWGYTFVPVQEALVTFPLFAFLALRFAIATLVLAVPGAARLRRLGRAGVLSGILAGALLGAGYALILLIGAWHYVDTLRMLGIEAEDLPVERWLLLLPLPLAFLLLLWRLLGIAAAILRGRRTGFDLADEAQDYVDQFDETADRAAGRAGGGVRP